MKVVYDAQIFLLQKYGGVSRYFLELYNEIKMDNSNNISAEFQVLFSQNYYLEQGIGKKMTSSSIIKNKYFNKILKMLNQIYLNLFLIGEYESIYHPTWNNLKYIPKKTKIVITVHDMIQEILWNDNPRYSKEILNKKEAIYKSDAIIAISQNTKRDILKIYPDIPESKITVVYHGTNHLPAEEKPKIHIPEKYILYVGRRVKYKGYQFMLEAISNLVEESEVNIVVAGSSLTDEEKRILKKLNIEDKIFKIQATDAELAYLYSHALCFVFPSEYEGFGFPILEAFDNRCPVLCSNTSCFPEIGGDAVEYFELNSKESLNKKLKSIIDDPNKRSHMIEQGLERVKNFTWEKCARETCKVYECVKKNGK